MGALLIQRCKQSVTVILSTDFTGTGYGNITYPVPVNILMDVFPVLFFQLVSKDKEYDQE